MSYPMSYACAVNRPSPTEVVEKVSARLEEVQHAIQIWRYLIPRRKHIVGIDMSTSI